MTCLGSPSLRRMILIAVASLLGTIVLFRHLSSSALAQGHTISNRVASTGQKSRQSKLSFPHWADDAVPIDKAPNRTILDGEAALHAFSIFNPSSNQLPRLECPPLDECRYAHLRSHGNSFESIPLLTTQPQQRPDIKYFFVLNLRTVAPLLPRLLGSVVDAIRFLGPSVCAISVVKGNSADITWEILHAIKRDLVTLGVPADRYTLVSSDLDPSNTEDRIVRLASLRNLAIAPVRAAYESNELAADAHVIFFNDVAACAEDMLELVHQRVIQHADMACAMDWVFHPPSHPSDPKDHGTAEFYDVWIARTMSGDSFFHITPSGSWSEATNLFPNASDALARERYRKRQPFQVYSCWNGGVALSAAAVAGPDSVRFRIWEEGEAPQGEPTLLCKDMWRKGMGRIAVVPSVNLEYTDEKGRGIKRLKGYTSDWTSREVEEGTAIHWRNEPPMTVRSWLSYDHQQWTPWRSPFEERDKMAEGRW